MPNESSNSGSYKYTGSGTNSQGNHHCSRDYGSAGTGYHYSNADGSYYYNNPDGSKYYNNGKMATLSTPRPAEARTNLPSNRSY
ncbi:hypothetical protein HD554DRAFT_2174068 [Boletus coccyginus]|nr:hypothetical protein HD554DRAFT_2174068 [Boletus coccyginus]